MPAQRRRAQDAEVRRAQILEEATRIIGERGYHGFAVQDLAQRCGLTNGGLLYHFGSKEHLLLAVLQERDRRLTAGIMADLGPEIRRAQEDAPPLGAVLAVLRSMMVRAAAQPELTRLHAVLQAESLDASHPAHAHFAAREALTLEGFAVLMRPHVSDPEAAARQIHALMDGLGLQWLRAELGFDLVAAWDQAVGALAWAQQSNSEDRRKGKK